MKRIVKYYSYDTSGNIVSEYKRVMVNGVEKSQTDVRYVRDNTGKAISMIQYDYSGQPSTVIGQRVYYFIYNGHGDVTALTDSTGTVVATYSYDEFGNQTSSTGNIYNPIRYSGAHNAYYDTETSLYKMGTRYYQSEVGRWLTRDSYEGEREQPQTQNRYVYAENGPVTKIDSTGHWASNIHYGDTKLLAMSFFNPYEAETIALADEDTDHDPTYLHGNTAAFHFSWGYGENKTWGSFKVHYDHATKASGLEGLKLLGHALHYLQDNYAYIHYHKRGGKKYHHPYTWPSKGGPSYARDDDKEHHHPWFSSNKQGNEWAYNNKVAHQKSWKPKRWQKTKSMTKKVLQTYKNRHYR